MSLALFLLLTSSYQQMVKTGKSGKSGKAASQVVTRSRNKERKEKLIEKQVHHHLNYDCLPTSLSLINNKYILHSFIAIINWSINIERNGNQREKEKQKEEKGKCNEIRKKSNRHFDEEQNKRSRREGFNLFSFSSQCRFLSSDLCSTTTMSLLQINFCKEREWGC